MLIKRCKDGENAALPFLSLFPRVSYRMSSADKTQIFAAPPLLVRVTKGDIQLSTERFVYGFKVGRGEECDIRCNDKHVSLQHLEVLWEDGQWWLQDLKSKNGTFVNGQRIERVPLVGKAEVQLARGGSSLVIMLESVAKEPKPTSVGSAASRDDIAQRYFGNSLAEGAGEHTRMIFETYQNVRRKHSKRYWWIIGSVGILLLGSLVGWYIEYLRAEKLKELNDKAENVFYEIKSLELKLSKSPEGRRIFHEGSDEQRKTYEKILQELGISKEKLSKEDWLIHKVAYIFGECDSKMPQAFVDSVKTYISHWRRSYKYRQGILRAKANNFPARTVRMLEEQYMPKQFFYLALQESGFDTSISGISIEWLDGICAKGMWQFIPQTARQYDLRTGSMIYRRVFDAQDERHNFEKSTRAAARYLRDLYNTKAQASGLLVMACYNWNEKKVIERIDKMPGNPRERNFWRLMSEYKIPRETQQYVLYIFSAAVIGEDPRFFGFNFDNPLASGKES